MRGGARVNNSAWRDLKTISHFRGGGGGGVIRGSKLKFSTRTKGAGEFLVRVITRARRGSSQR